MKRIFIGFLFACSTYDVHAQLPKEKGPTIATPNTSVAFRLYPTQNMWTFLKLNTRTGEMWQVQFNADDENRLTATMSSKILVTKDKELNDRFTLYPTQNIYTFILLDQLDGRTWQVQWSIDPENRLLIPIE